MDYLDMNLDLSQEDIALREAAHKFAAEVMRPIARQIDLMSATEAVAADSPFWTFLKKAYELGYHKALYPEAVGGLGLTPLQTHLANFACMTGDGELIERFGKPFFDCTDGSCFGCWAVTEPDHGSDVLGLDEPFYYSPKIQGSIKAVPEGNEWVINGQTSAWVTGAPVASHVFLHLQADLSKGLEGFGICIVPLDLKGVAKGKPIEKIGQRDLCQGEIFFDDVRVPKKWMVVGSDRYVQTWPVILCLTNLGMGTWATGLARAAFEEALTYSKERVQGGKPIIEHYTTKQRLFETFSRVETCRALSRAVAIMNLTRQNPVLEYSLVSKTRCTQLCLDNAHAAVQILGGNGLSKEYYTEKLFRDARATLIMDGLNEISARSGGWLVSQHYPRRGA